jgi:DNA (cytosine-5)-methyltransferase 1
LALFAGAGGGILGGHLLGWRTVCAVERDPYAVGVLLARQNDGCLPAFPIWDDVSTFDGRPWRGRVDVVSGGFPCQDISAAGRGAGITGARSGLWGEMARIIREVRPRFVLVENSPMLTLRGLDVVLGDLAAMGFDAEWGVLGADDAGAPHERQRIWVVGSDAAGAQCKRRGVSERVRTKHAVTCDTRWWSAEPDVDRVAHGVAARVDRLRCIGNGQVPAVAALAWSILRR